MAKARPSVQKRIHEAKVHEKKLAKAARKAARDAERAARDTSDVEGDPDLVGIRPGPPPAIEYDENGFEIVPE